MKYVSTMKALRKLMKNEGENLEVRSYFDYTAYDFNSDDIEFKILKSETQIDVYIHDEKHAWNNITLTYIKDRNVKHGWRLYQRYSNTQDIKAINELLKKLNNSNNKEKLAA